MSSWVIPNNQQKNWSPYLEHAIKSGQGFNEQISSLVAEFITAGGEHVKGLVQVKIHVTIEVASDEVVDLFLALSVEILEFVEGSELDNIQSIGSENIGLAFQKVFGFQVGDFTEKRKNNIQNYVKIILQQQYTYLTVVKIWDMEQAALSRQYLW